MVEEAASRHHWETVIKMLERVVSWSAKSGKLSMRVLRSGVLSLGQIAKASDQAGTPE